MRSLLIICLLIYSQFAFAIQQASDSLIYKGDTITTASKPLTYYLLQSNNELINYLNSPDFKQNNSYVAIWEVKNDSLFLTKITRNEKIGIKNKSADLKKIFGTNDVFANWFSGEIILPKRKHFEYISIGNDTMFKEERIFTFNEGKLENEKLKSNKKIADEIIAGKRNWMLTKKSLDTIFYHIKTNINWEREGDLKHMCDDEYLLTFNKNGEIKKVKFKPLGTTKKEKRQDWWYNLTECHCKHIVKKSLKDLNLAYLIPGTRFTVDIGMFYDIKKKNLELWTPYALKDKNNN